MNVLKNHKKINLEFIIECLVLLIVLVLLIYKSPCPFFHKLLWAEDGNIFLEGARNGFLNSLITPYQGYLHLTQRLVAGFSLFFDLKFTPIIYLFAPVLAICALVHTIFVSFNISLWKKSLIALLIVLTHVDASVFNNLTNIQWIWASILMIFLCVEYKFTNNIKKGFFALVVLILGLTGPFSTLFLPVLCLRAIVKKDFKRYLFFYIPFIISASIQLLVLSFSQRVSGNPHHLYHISYYFKNIIHFMTYISHYPVTSCIIFLGLFYLFTRNLYSNFKDEKNYIVSSLLLCGAIITMSTIFMGDDSSKWINPSGCRYTYNLYFACLTSIILLLNNKHFLIGIILMLTLSSGFTDEKLLDIYWDSNVLLYKSLPEVVININPVNWTAHLKNDNKNSYKKSNYSVLIKNQNVEPKIIVDSQTFCPNSSDIGFVFSSKLSKTAPSNLTFEILGENYIRETGFYLIENSYKSFMAFPINRSKINILLPKENTSANYTMDVYCLGHSL